MAPRLNTAKTPKPAAVRTGPAPIGDNQHGEEAERVQLIAIVSKLSQADDAVEVARGPLKAAQKARSQIIGLGKAAGFTAKELEKRLDEMRMPTREAAVLEAREHKHRRWLGIIDDDQAKLQLGDTAPAEAKDEAHWKGEGYKAGLRQQVAKPPPECPERFVQAWLEEHVRGKTEVLTANAPKKSGLRQKAAEDFKDDNPDVDVDAAARKLKKDAAFMDRSAPPEIVDEDPLGVNDGFEATEEELAAQRPRLAVVGSREADESETVV